MFKKILYLCLLICLAFVFGSQAQGQIAVFPFEDLSKDINGVNLELSEMVAQGLEDQGFQVVHPQRVLDFLAQSRIRWTGWAERLTAARAARELGTDLILLGTVTELDPQEPALGLSLRILRARDYKLIWSKTISLSGLEEVSLLGLGRHDFQSLISQAIYKIMASLPADLERSLAQPPIFEIADVFVRPRHVRGGKRIECAVRLDVSGDAPEEVYFVLPSGRRIPTIKRGELYVAWWTAPRKEGRYPVNILLKWGEPWQFEKKQFLSSFVVDNTPPKLELRTIKGESLPQGVAFKRHIVLVPVMGRPEPVSRWLLRISSVETGQIVVNEERPGRLPTSFTWRGADQAGHRIPDGRYRVSLQVWDQAGNTSVAEQDLIVVKGAPPVNLQARAFSEKMVIKFNIGSHPVPVSEWRLELWDKDGNLIAEYEGQRPPKFLTAPKKEGLYYTLEVRDILGNRRFVRNEELKPIIMRAAEEKKKAEEKKWVDDF
ncbi:hypothetical protein [Thermosulfuriphilus sp.]